MTRSWRLLRALLPTLLPTLLAIVAIASAASAQVDPVRSVLYDLFEAGDPSRITYETPCEGSSFTVEERGFTFREEAGATSLACGSASWRVEIPPETDHIHVRFLADRVPDPMAAGVTGGFRQEIRIQDVNGATLAIYPYHEPSDEAAEPAYHDVVNYPVPDGMAFLDVVWWFEELGLEGVTSPIGPIDTGTRWTATVRAPEVEHSGIPVLDAHVEQEGRRSGTVVVDDAVVHVPVPRDLAQRYGVTIRVAVHPDLVVDRVVTPTDEVLLDAISRNVTNRHTTAEILLEQGRGQLQVYVPTALVDEHGPGTYALHFRGVSDLNTIPALIPVAGLLLLVPIPFAVAAVRGARTFEREAFGGFRRSAHHLGIAVPLAVAYYVVVVVAALVGRRLELMAAWPLGLEAFFLYLQVFVAIAAFLTLWLVARELARLTRPPEERT